MTEALQDAAAYERGESVNLRVTCVPARPKPIIRTAKRGDWVNCWFDSKQNVDRCRVTFVDGRLLYEGTYLPYQSEAPAPQEELVIDSRTMNRAQEQVEVNASSQESSEPGVQVLPLIYLRNGEILIPEKAYQAGRKRLDALRAAHGKEIR